MKDISIFYIFTLLINKHFFLKSATMPFLIIIIVILLTSLIYVILKYQATRKKELIMQQKEKEMQIIKAYFLLIDKDFVVRQTNYIH